jgi:hypothetical protein
LKTLVSFPLARLEAIQERLEALPSGSDDDKWRRNPVTYLEGIGWALRAWQRYVIDHRDEPVMVVATRQGGKTWLFAALAWWLGMNRPNTLAAIVCPDQAKGETLIERVRDVSAKDMQRPKLDPDNTEAKGLPNGSIIRGLPGTIKGVVSKTAQMLVFDEAGLIPANLYRAATPMQSAVENPWTFAISSAWYKDGWFWDEWDKGTAFRKVLVRAAYEVRDRQIVDAEPEETFKARWAEKGVTAFYSPTPTREFLEMELSRHPEWQIRQQYFCEFQEVENAALTPEAIASLWAQGIKSRVRQTPTDSGIPARRVSF